MEPPRHKPVFYFLFLLMGFLMRCSLAGAVAPENTFSNTYLHTVDEKTTTVDEDTTTSGPPARRPVPPQNPANRDSVRVGGGTIQDGMRNTDRTAAENGRATLENGRIPSEGGRSSESGNRPPPGGAAAPAISGRDAVRFQARDSLTFRLTPTRLGTLHGTATVSYDKGSLEAGAITLDLNQSQVEASSPTQTDTLAFPRLRQGSTDLRSRRILYNFDTGKGKFEAAEAKVDQGHVIGKAVKNISDTEVFIKDAVYSSCPPDYMYYYIKADRMKIVDEEEVFFTNARLYILDIPYPLVFPFGYIPAGIETRKSGLLEPTYLFQNTSSRGLGIQNIGWFQYINDYLTAQTSFDLFTSGSYYNDTRLQYRFSDQFSGSITLGFSNERGLESTDPDFSETKSRRLSISHNQQINPFSSLTANINLNTSNFFQQNSYDLDERVQTSSTSRLSYRYNHPEGAYNFTIASNLNQQFATGSARWTGPDLNFTLRQFNPFESWGEDASDNAWYQKISVSYRNNFRSNYNFQPLDGTDSPYDWFESLLDPAKYEEATGNDRHLQFGFIQKAQIRAGQLIPSRYLNVSANIDINEYWYPSTSRRVFNPEENNVETFRENGFATARDFNASLAFSTTLYGMSEISVGSYEGLRHTMRPNISFGFRPDFSSERWGFYEEVQTDTLGNTRLFSRFDREVFGGPPATEQRAISFGINNVIETKHVRRDTTGEMTATKVKLIESLSVNGSYNFAVDSLRFSQINVSMSSRFIEGVRIQASARYSLYDRNENGREINQLLWLQDGSRIAQPLNYRFSISTSFEGGSSYANIKTPPYRPYDPFDQTYFSPVDVLFNREPVRPLRTPWRFSLDFSYSWTYQFGQPARKSAQLQAGNISFRLTPKWSVRTRLGYDFIEKELTPSQFSFNREMECWNLSFELSPFGDFQYYSFRLSLNMSQVQSLFQKLPGLNNLERSSNTTGRPPRF